MKKLLSILLIFILIFSCVGCTQKDDDETAVIANVTEPETQAESQKETTENKQPESATQTDNKEIKIEGSVTTSCGLSSNETTQMVTVSKYDENILPTVNKKYKFNSVELAKLLTCFEYTEDLCRFPTKYVVTINEKSFYIDSDYRYVNHGANTHTLTDSEKAAIQDILNKNVIYQNFVSLEAQENKVILTYKSTEKSVKYSFKNKDADRLLMIITEAELTKGQIPSNPEYEFLLFSGADRFVMSLACKKPFVAAGDKIAYLTKAQQNEIQVVLNANCTEQNIVKEE